MSTKKLSTKAKATKTAKTKRQPRARKSSSSKATARVDYYPNRMMVAVAVLAAVSITLLGLMVQLTQ